MARKAVAQVPAQRRSGVNRAQLKALAAQQAMSSAAATRPIADPDATGESSALDLSAVGPIRRRYALSREQEMSYIRADIIRLLLVSAILLVVLLGALFLLR